MALTGGVGHDHAGGHHILSLGGQIVAGITPRVRTTTVNLGHLMAFIRALEWALIDETGAGAPGRRVDGMVGIWVWVRPERRTR